MMAHYIAGPDAPSAIRCPRCKRCWQPNGWATVNGQQVPRSGDHIERAFDLPGYGQAWLCHDCAGDALAAVLAMLAEWARVDATIAEHCPDAVSVKWQPCDGWGLGLWCVHVKDRSHEEHLRRIRVIRRALQPLRVAVEVCWEMGQ